MCPFFVAPNSEPKEPFKNVHFEFFSLFQNTVTLNDLTFKESLPNSQRYPLIFYLINNEEDIVIFLAWKVINSNNDTNENDGLLNHNWLDKVFKGPLENQTFHFDR